MVQPSNSLCCYFISPSWEQLIYLYYPFLLSLSLNFVEPRDSTVCFSNSIRKAEKQSWGNRQREGGQEKQPWHIKGNTDPGSLGNGNHTERAWATGSNNLEQQRPGALFVPHFFVSLSSQLLKTWSCRDVTWQAPFSGLVCLYQCKPTAGISKGKAQAFLFPTPCFTHDSAWICGLFSFI